MDIPYPLTTKDEQALRNLNYDNDPIQIILLDSGSDNMSIETLDTIHKGFGLSMFAFHYYIDRDGNVYGGRPERAIGGNVPLLMSKLMNGTAGDSIAMYDGDMKANLDNLTTYNSFAGNRLFICIEGDTKVAGFTSGQESSLINLCRDIMGRHRNIRNVYSLREMVPMYNNLGGFIDMNRLRATINSSIPNMWIDLPSGEVSYTFGSRELFYDPENLQSGNDIKTLQVYLTALGFKVEKASGVYDLFTYNMVTKFQEVYGLAVTGDFDKNDFDKIIELIKNKDIKPEYGRYYRYLKYIPNNPLHDVPNLADGSKNDIYILQHKLVKLHYQCPLNGIYDAATEAAVKEYQKDFGLQTDGRVGPALWEQLMETEVYYYEGLISLTDPVTEGPIIKYIQRQIDRAKRRYNITITTLNGRYDLTTSNNIKKIQMLEGLPVTGVVDEATWAILDSIFDKQRKG